MAITTVTTMKDQRWLKIMIQKRLDAQTRSNVL